MSAVESLGRLATESGFAAIFAGDGWKLLVMIGIACVLLYLGIKKQYEPLLMVGIAMGCLLANVSALGGFSEALYHQELWDDFMTEGNEFYHSYGHVMANGGLIDFLYIGVKAGIYPCLIFIGIGAMTDFGPLISNPKSLLLGAAAQFGVFFAFFGATLLRQGEYEKAVLYFGIAARQKPQNQQYRAAYMSAEAIRDQKKGHPFLSRVVSTFTGRR